MKELEFPRIGERCYYDTLPNGLPVYVLPKPGFSKSFAFFAVHYGGNDTHFRVGERGIRHRRVWHTIWNTRCLTCRRAMPFKSCPNAVHR